MAGESRIAPTNANAGRGFPWVASFFGAVIVGGFDLVLWAVLNDQVQDIAASPYHLPMYLGLLGLVVFCAVLAARAQRRGRGWRRALPDGYGLLGAGAATFLLGLILDLGWREGVGIPVGIEEAFAPSRVAVIIALGMIAITPLRAALVLGADRVPKLPVLASAAFTLAALGWPGGFHPAASPWLAVDPSLPQLRADLWVMDADGSHQTRLIESEPGTSLGYASWAPDGSRVGYTTFDLPPAGIAASRASVWTAAADGSGAYALLDGAEWGWIPRFTPDGAWVLYTREAQGGPWMEEGPVGPGAAVGPLGPLSIPVPDADVWRVPASGDGESDRLTDSTGDDRAPVPSPDGSLILFDATRDGNTELYVMDADGSNQRRLTNDAGEDWGGSWSPDGRQIAFNSSRTGDMEIYVMDADGGNVRQVTHDRGANVSPTWAPDGTRLAFTARDTSGSGQIRSVALDGSDPRDLSRSATSDDSVWTGGWGPDGRIVFNRTMGPRPEATPLVRLDLGAAAMLLSTGLIATVVVLLARTAPPLGSFTLMLGLATALLAAPAGEWRFVAAGIVAGLAADLAAWLTRSPMRGRATGTAAAAAFVLAAGTVALATTGLEWGPTLLLGVALAAGAIGWGIGALAEGHDPVSS